MEYLFMVGGIAVAYVVYGVTDLALRDIRLERDLSNKDNKPLKLDALPPCILEKQELKLYSMDDILRNTILEFEMKLKSMPHVDMRNFYSNFRSYRVSVVDGDFGYSYEFETNEIKICRGDDMRENLLYALVNLCATNTHGGVIGSGLMRSHEGVDQYGNGLTRGYSRILTNRLFNINGQEEDEIVLLEDIARLIESLVGREEMESAYFSNGIERVVETLGDYSTVGEAMKLIRELDHLHMGEYINTPILNIKIAETFRDVVSTLSSMTITKLRVSSISDEDDIKESTKAVDNLIRLLEEHYFAMPIMYVYPKDERIKTLKEIEGILNWKLEPFEKTARLEFHSGKGE